MVVKFNTLVWWGRLQVCSSRQEAFSPSSKIHMVALEAGKMLLALVSGTAAGTAIGGLSALRGNHGDW